MKKYTQYSSSGNSTHAQKKSNITNWNVHFLSSFFACSLSFAVSDCIGILLFLLFLEELNWLRPYTGVHRIMRSDAFVCHRRRRRAFNRDSLSFRPLDLSVSWWVLCMYALHACMVHIWIRQCLFYKCIAMMNNLSIHVLCKINTYIHNMRRTYAAQRFSLWTNSKFYFERELKIGANAQKRRIGICFFRFTQHIHVYFYTFQWIPG